ncbi:MAG: glycosyltransferase family 4 protein [Akkermansiaceae bacterium]|nr:glycosyltransferase family 4 protein [Akkermansiaceae bacterium]
MHLVFLNQYFPPDEAPTGVMLEGVAAQAVKNGHRVTIICSEGGYAVSEQSNTTITPESADYQMIRIRTSKLGRRTFLGKVIDYLAFYVGVAIQLAVLENRPDRIIALTTPPYLSVLARFFSKFYGGTHAHWVMDLYPDVMDAHGMLKPGSLSQTILKSLTRWGFGGARNAGVLTLGPDMDQRTAAYLNPSCRHHWVPLWSTTENSATEAEISAWRKSKGWKSEKRLVMYSGNMGLGHRFGEFLDAIESLSSDPTNQYHFVFCGDGKRRKEIEEFLLRNPQAPIELTDYVPRSELHIHLSCADVHLASMEPRWDGTMVPSKIQGIFAMGRPVIFVGSRESSIGQWITESGGGWVIAPDETPDLIEILKDSNWHVECLERGERAKKYAEQHFSESRNASGITSFFTVVSPSDPAYAEK